MSSTPRLYIYSSLRESEPVRLDDDASKYLLRVMRLGAGDRVRVFNGADGEWMCELAAPEGKTAILVPVEHMRPQPDASVPNLTLLFAPVKKAETDFIVEKATELGVRYIQPVVTEYTQARTVRLDRFNKIALEAAEQTERLDLPEVADIKPLNAALDGLAEGTVVIFCDEAGEDKDAPWGGQVGRAGPIAEVLPGLDDGPAAILIGPEGGFSADERAWLRGRKNTYPVSLGPRILRAETAVVAALTVWQALKGDWR